MNAALSNAVRWLLSIGLHFIFFSLLLLYQPETLRVSHVQHRCVFLDASYTRPAGSAAAALRSSPDDFGPLIDMAAPFQSGTRWNRPPPMTSGNCRPLIRRGDRSGSKAQAENEPLPELLLIRWSVWRCLHRMIARPDSHGDAAHPPQGSLTSP
jgi:hypothetical protein